MGIFVGLWDYLYLITKSIVTVYIICIFNALFVGILLILSMISVNMSKYICQLYLYWLYLPLF